MASKKKRSVAARKGWETRRRKSRQELRNKRSRAAKKGWATRREKARVASIRRSVRGTVGRGGPAYDIDDIADAIGVDAEDLAEDLGLDPEDDFWDEFDEDDYDELADMLDLDVSDIYDMHYGYEPGSHGR